MNGRIDRKICTIQFYYIQIFHLFVSGSIFTLSHWSHGSHSYMWILHFLDHRLLLHVSDPQNVSVAILPLQLTTEQVFQVTSPFTIFTSLSVFDPSLTRTQWLHGSHYRMWVSHFLNDCTLLHFRDP